MVTLFITQRNIFLNCKPIAQIQYKDSTWDKTNNRVRKTQVKLFKNVALRKTELTIYPHLYLVKQKPWMLW